MASFTAQAAAAANPALTHSLAASEAGSPVEPMRRLSVRRSNANSTHPATPAEAVSWGKINPGVLPDTVVAYADSTIAFPLFCEYVVGSKHGMRRRKALVHKRDQLLAALVAQAKAVQEKRDGHPVV